MQYWKGLPGINTLAYYKHLQITDIKSLMTLDSRDQFYKTFYCRNLQMLVKQRVFAPAKSYQPIGIIVSNSQVKQLCLFNQVYSIIPFIKSSEYLCGGAQVNK
jgi:hypothetical protein